MTTDTGSVQNTGQVSPTEPVPPVVKPSEEGVKQQPVALSPEQEQRVQQLIAEATAKAVEQAKELGKRELQSQQDRNRAEIARAQGRAKLAESSLGAVKTHLQQIDPEAAKEMELAEYRTKEKERATIEQEEAVRAYQMEVVNRFHAQMSQFVTNLGIDPNDKRLDWAADAPDLLTAQQRILDSASKIQKENVQTMQNSLEKRLKEVESKIGQANIEANSVETTTSPGVVAGSDAEFIKQFGSGELPYTKENEARYLKLKNSY